jgi:clan AA aspartic protease
VAVLTGFFEDGYPFIKIEVEQVALPLNALVDTGFTGELMLPSDLLDEAGLPQMGTTECLTASGEVMLVGVYRGWMSWLRGRTPVRILATRGRTVLLGMGLLRHGRLVMEPSSGTLVIDGGM